MKPIARAADLPPHYNAVEILTRNLPARANEPALLSVERSCTFGEIAAEVMRVANALHRLGLRRDDVVAILAPDSVEWVSAFFGTLAAGGVALGMNTLLKPHELAFQLEDSRARILIAGAALLGPLRAHLPGPFLTHVIVLGEVAEAHEIPFAEWLAREPARCEVARTHREDICSINYSSGTTGEPKGVPHAHKDLPLCAQLWGVNVLGLCAEDRTFSAARLFFTFGTGGGLVFPWYVGASAVLMSGSPRVAGNVLETVQRFRPTILYNAPTGYAMALALPNLTERYDLTSLRLCVSAGEALPASLWHAWKERTGLDILDGIGSTENWHIFLSNRPGDIRPGSTGKPFAGYELELVGEDGRAIHENGVIGNLWVKGETAALSYLRRGEQSKKTFRGEWLVTGDKYSRDAEGYFWHAGRADDMLKVGGLWVSPVEVESALVAHEAVLECAVVACADDAGLIKPKALVVAKPGHEPAKELAAKLVEHCRERMAEYKRPRWIEFVDELPKTATGKIQRFRLLDEGLPLDTPRPRAVGSGEATPPIPPPSRAAEVVLPCSELDLTLAFFTERLGFRIETISPADDPSVAVLAGHGARIRFMRGAPGSAGVLRLSCADPSALAGGALELTAPNGTRIELVGTAPAFFLPPMQPSFVLARMEGTHWVNGRAGMRYRDLIPGRQGGRFIASHIRIPSGGAVPDQVHFHRVRFQLIYCYRGWVRLVYEDQGPPFVLQAGDCVLQPPEIRHRVLESSPGLEVIEVACPAQHDTCMDHELSLPTSRVLSGRSFGGQRFARHEAAGARWQPWRLGGFECRDMGIGGATEGLAGARVVRPDGRRQPQPQQTRHDAEFLFQFVLQGSLTLEFEGGAEELGTGDSCVIPAERRHALAERSEDLELLEVSLPSEIGALGPPAH